MKKLFRKLKLNKKGFTFAECVAAIALFAVIGTMGFTMFSISNNYMTKSKREEAKRAEAYESALADTFMDASGNYIIYESSCISKIYTVLSTSSTDENVFANIIYSTSYGDVTYSIPISFDKRIDAERPYSRYKVLMGNSTTTRYILIYEQSTVRGTLSASEYSRTFS